jgi:aryl-alcohol dehydrogenase-like predicted oxidoreductase
MGQRGATAAGTARYRDRHAPDFALDHYRAGPAELTLSSIGLGTYLGGDVDSDDDAYTDAVRCALRSGINVFDTAINYRCQRSERAVGRAIQLALANGGVTRDEIVLCTKAGYVPLENFPPATQEGYQGYLKREFYARRVMTPADVVAGGHCIAPGFLLDCLRRSRQNLGVDAIDVFYVHNPEQQLSGVRREELHVRLRAAFEALEERAAAGEIGVYGISTWQGLRAAPGARGHLSLEELVALAREVAGDGHHLRVVQFPLNLAMPEAVRLPTQSIGGGDPVPAVDAARALGLTVITSAPLMQGGLAHGLPPALQELFPSLTTDAQRAIAFSRAVAGVTTTLVGMKRAAHIEENLGAAR